MTYHKQSSTLGPRDLWVTTYHHHLARTPHREVGMTVLATSQSHLGDNIKDFKARIHSHQITGSLHDQTIPRNGRPLTAAPPPRKTNSPWTYLSAGSDGWTPEFIRPNDFISLNTSMCMKAVNELIILGNLPSWRQLLMTKDQKGAERQKASKPQRHLRKWTIMIH